MNEINKTGRNAKTHNGAYFAAILLLIIGVVLIKAGKNPATTTSGEEISFNEDIRPILNSKCIACHGGVTKQGGISYIFREEALKRGNSGRLNVVPGKPARSELIARVTSDDPLLRMPFKKEPLSAEEISLLQRWIEQGANWEEHWAFVQPETEGPPQQPFTEWSSHPVDAFIAGDMHALDLTPTPEAKKEKLLRRLSLDLTGLPPSPEEIRNFLKDDAANAYERQVDRLLSSPRFGEKWASMWLDSARYADSMGYVRDLERDSWPYRDWLIRAYNANMPYDKFVRYQLAGDLIDGAGLKGLIASAFHRQTPTNLEGGSDNEEYRMVAVMDRVATTWQVLNGLTMACVQCHSHPYDPFLHVDYYKSLAFFNSSSDFDLVTDAPTLRVPIEESARIDAYLLHNQKKLLMDDFLEQLTELNATSSWSDLEVTGAATDRREGWRRRLALVEAAVVANDWRISDEQKKKYLRYASEALEQIAMPENTTVAADLISGADVQFPVGVAAVAEYQLATSTVSQEINALQIEALPFDPDTALHTPEDGFAIEEIRVSLRHASGDEEPITLVGILADSQDAIRHQAGNIFAQALSGSNVVSGFTTEKLRHSRSVTLVPETGIIMDEGDNLVLRLSQAQLMRFRQPAPVLRRVNIKYTSDSRWRDWVDGYPQTALLKALIEIDEKLAAISAADLPVMEELPLSEQPTTLLFERGDMGLKTGHPLVGGVPDILPPLPAGAAPDRETLANWFFSADQPLTARVAVNRYWEQLFGRGLVETLEDFGSSGTPPSHPELLDWLALEFQHALDWDRKAMIRLIVTSQTYRQSASCAKINRTLDPTNRLLSCGPRQRLTAEMVRDQALAASGLMVNKIGGPPVMPPQPEGIWNSKNNNAQWIESVGEDRYRRAIYTYFKQSTPYPSAIIFDHASRDVSVSRRVPTNTPLQALVLLNDPVFVEAGDALANLMMLHSQEVGSFEAGLRNGYLRVMSREPSISEIATLGDTFVKIQAETGELASAWEVVAMILLNTDESITR